MKIERFRTVIDRPAPQKMIGGNRSIVFIYGHNTIIIRVS